MCPLNAACRVVLLSWPTQEHRFPMPTKSVKALAVRQDLAVILQRAGAIEDRKEMFGRHFSVTPSANELSLFGRVRRGEQQPCPILQDRVDEISVQFHGQLEIVPFKRPAGRRRHQHSPARLNRQDRDIGGVTCEGSLGYQYVAGSVLVHSRPGVLLARHGPALGQKLHPLLALAPRHDGLASLIRATP